MILRTTNKFKIQDYKAMNFPNILIMNGIELKEVIGTIEEVIIYKTLEAEIEELVEDATLRINGKEFIDMKYQIKEIDKKHKNEKVELIISIGLNLKEEIKIYYGIVEGYLFETEKIDISNGYDINNHFIPAGYDKPLYMIKDFLKITPRYIALSKILNNTPDLILQKKDIKVWKGEYQK